MIGVFSGEGGVIDWMGGDMRLNRSVFSVSFLFWGEKRESLSGVRRLLLGESDPLVTQLVAQAGKPWNQCIQL